MPTRCLKQRGKGDAWLVARVRGSGLVEGVVTMDFSFSQKKNSFVKIYAHGCERTCPQDGDQPFAHQKAGNALPFCATGSGSSIAAAI
jgi:hypothetical protein